MDKFKKRKEAILNGVDLSRKGSIDASIVHLVQLINDQEQCVTTSSCSGRICLVEQKSEGKVQKKGCPWLYMSHDKASRDQVAVAVKKAEGNAVFKFEGFVLHVQCADLSFSSRMLAEAVASGFRNSGLTISGKGRITLAVRSTHSLEVPLTACGQLLVSDEYISYITDLANSKLEENNLRISRLYERWKATFMEKSPEDRLSPAKKGRKRREVKPSKESADLSVEEYNPASDMDPSDAIADFFSNDT